MFSATVTYLLGDRNGLCIQHVEHSGSQTISSIFGQPALAGKDIFDPFGWHSNRQLINQPAALRSGSIMAELQGGRETITSRDVGVFFSRSMCVCERHWDSECLAAPPSLPHLDLFDLPHVWTVGLEALQRAGLKALHPVWQVQPQPFCLCVIGPYDDHKSPAGGARVALQTGADGDVIRYDCTGRGRHLVIGARHNVKIVCVWRFFYVFLLGSSTSSSSFFFLFFLFMLLSTLFAVRAGFFLLFRPSRTPS